MTVRRIWCAGRHYEVTGEGYRSEGKIEEIVGQVDSEVVNKIPVDLNQSNVLATLITNGFLNNNATLTLPVNEPYIKILEDRRRSKASHGVVTNGA